MMMRPAGHRRRRISAALLLGALPWPPAGAQAPAPELRIAAVQKDALSWVAARLLTEIYRAAGLRLVIEPLPAIRAGMAALGGELDGELIRIRAYSQRHPQLLRVEPAYYRLSVQAYSLPTRRLRIASREDLRLYTLGAVRGLSYVPELTAGHPALTQAQNAEQLFRMLQAGRLDLVLESSVSAGYVLDRLALHDVTASPELAHYELYHYLHPRHRELLPRLSEAIRRLKASGELGQLSTYYESMVIGLSPERLTPGEQAPARP